MNTTLEILAVKSAGSMLVALLLSGACMGQDLTPRAYLITPNRSNAIVVTNSFFSGNLEFNGAITVADATAKVNVPIISFYHSLNFFGRSANVTASVPYAAGNFIGTVLGAETNAYRSGMFDSVVRFSANLKGGPAMDLTEFMKYQQKTVIGVSMRVVVPTGQYDPKRLINYSANRWAFKPEIGFSRRLRHWVLDGYGGVWLYTANPEFFSNNAYVPFLQRQTREPIGALEGHLSYDVKPRLWVSLDSNFWYGGRTSLNGIQNPASLQRNSRLGATASFPLNRRQSIKVSYSKGTYIRYGGNFQNLSIGWQYGWVWKPRRPRPAKMNASSNSQIQEDAQKCEDLRRLADNM